MLFRSGEIGSLRDERELIDAEFNEIVADFDEPNIAQLGTQYLDQLDEIDALERYEGDNKELPTLSKVQRAALIGVILGPLYAIAVRFLNFDPLGFGFWPGLVALLGGITLFFWQLRPEPDEDEGIAL